MFQSNKPAQESEKEKKPKLLFFYGTQTGTAEDFSTQLQEDGTERGFECEVTERPPVFCRIPVALYLYSSSRNPSTFTGTV